MRASAKKYLVYSFFFCLFFIPIPARAVSLKGFAHITYQRGNKIFNFDQVIILKDNGYHYFEVIDDFGNSVWSLKGNLSQKILKKMGIPIPLNTFLDLLKYDISVDSIKTGQDNLHRIVSVTPKEKKEKWQVTYDQFEKVNKLHFPWLIKIKSNKTQLTIQWIHLSLI